MSDQVGWIEYAVIVGYLVALVGIGFVFRSFNKDVSDYFRSGCRGTWWLVGSSAFMQLFSAWTFTGAAGAAFEAGWSVMVIFAANVLAFFLVFLFLGPWFRQLRAVTAPEIIRLRFGPTTQQMYAWLQGALGVLYASIWLLGLSTFMAAVFSFESIAASVGLSEVGLVVVVTGVIVVAYSVTGGSWAVMATDFVQSLILIPLTLLVAFLCLREIGGVDGLLTQIDEQGLKSEFALIKEQTAEMAEKFPLGKYGLWFAIATLSYKTMVYSTLVTAQRYFGVKDGREARKAGLLACGLMLAGMLVWFVPPVVARLTIADEVLATELSKPAEASYALIAMRVLPIGMTGLMVVAMLAATMSSMDSGLNRNAAVFVRDIQPLFRKLRGGAEPTPRQEMLAGKIASVVLGLTIISLALYFANSSGEKGVFEFMLDIGAIVGLPMAIPMMLALFIRRVPWWSAIVSVAAASIPSFIGFVAGKEGGIAIADAMPDGTRLASLFSETWSYQQKIFSNASVGILAFLGTAPFWSRATESYRAQVTEFFRRMHTPVDFEREVGGANDSAQLVIIGGFAAAMGSLILVLMLVPGNDLSARLSILFVGGSVAGVGGLLCWAGRGSKKRERRSPKTSGHDRAEPKS
ncbi:MAG: hypothetical protein AAGG07_06200 [Planctomycetota bacterium]